MFCRDASVQRARHGTRKVVSALSMPRIGGLRQTADRRESEMPYSRCMCSWQVLSTVEVHLPSTGETVHIPHALGQLSRWEYYLRR